MFLLFTYYIYELCCKANASLRSKVMEETENMERSSNKESDFSLFPPNVLLLLIQQIIKQ